jgi:predicted amidophosphoribosyltransferase
VFPENQPLARAISRRHRRELATARAMIGIFCRGHHPAGASFCQDCQELWDYTRTRVERCAFGQDKPTCLNCTVHCFRREMRERIRAVMRYAGPRMPLRHPLLSLLHLIDGRRPAPRKQ